MSCFDKAFISPWNDLCCILLLCWFCVSSINFPPT